MTDSVSLQGARHVLAGMANQDACEYVEEDGCLIFAVCDGVSLDLMGRPSHSEVASAYCARAFVEFVRSHRQMEDAVREGFSETVKGLADFLKGEGMGWYDCQTTLIGGLYDHGTLSVGIAGDGGLFVVKEDGQVSMLVTKGKTSSVVEPICFVEGWRFSRVEGVRAFLAATDGVFDGLAGMTEDGFQFNEELISMFLAVPGEAGDHERLLKALCSLIESGDDQTVLVFDSQV